METSTISTLAQRIESTLKNLQSYMQSKTDIIGVLKQDHMPLKECIKIMKDSEKPLRVRIIAFQEFAPLLLTHAKAEEKALYEYMKTVSPLRENAFEGDTEHILADQLCEEIKRTSDPDKLGARIKVLAELVEHHIEEEENEMFPEIQKRVSSSKLQELTKVYVSVQEQIISQGQTDSPSEKVVSFVQH